MGGARGNEEGGDGGNALTGVLISTDPTNFINVRAPLGKSHSGGIGSGLILRSRKQCQVDLLILLDL